MINLGKVQPGSTLYIPFETFASSSGAPITLTGLATSDIKIYKDGGTTERASASGFTLLDTDGIDFDAITGIHGFSIDLADNTTADFYASGSQYIVVVSTVTVDSQTMSFIAAVFRIGETGSILDTTIATLASQTSFTLTSGPAEDDALKGRQVVIHDTASAVQQGWGVVSAYTGATKTVTLATAPTFTIAAKDNVSFLSQMPVQPTTAGRTLDITSTGAAGIDWGNVENPTTTVSFTGSTIGTVTTLTNLPAITTNWLTSAGLATDAVEEIRNAITGGAYALNTSATGSIRIVDGTGVGEINTNGGKIVGVELVDTLTTYTGNTVQTGDSFGRIGAAGAGLTAVPWNASWDAEVQSEVDDALVAQRLDELLNADSDIDGAAPPTVGSVFHELMSKTAGSFTFDQTTDSNEALRDRGDAAWTTATGFSTHTAADVWAVATRVLTAGTNIALAKGTGVTGFNDLDAAGIRSAVGLATANLDTQLSTINTNVNSILADTGTDGVVVNAAGLATDAVQEIRSAITGGAYALNTSATGSIRIVDGTATDEVDLASGLVGVQAASVRTAIGLASANLDTQLDTLPTAAECAAALLDLADGIETGVTPRQAWRAISAKSMGVISGAGTGTEVVKGIGVATTRGTATVDSSGNISAWTLNL